MSYKICFETQAAHLILLALMGGAEPKFPSCLHFSHKYNKDIIIFSTEQTSKLHLSRLMGKPTICIGENKGADQLRGFISLISAFVFATRVVLFPFYLNPKFQTSSSFLCLYRLVCVGPVQKPRCWFSHKAAYLL